MRPRSLRGVLPCRVSYLTLPAAGYPQPCLPSLLPRGRAEGENEQGLEALPPVQAVQAGSTCVRPGRSVTPSSRCATPGAGLRAGSARGGGRAAAGAAARGRARAARAGRRAGRRAWRRARRARGRRGRRGRLPPTRAPQPWAPCLPWRARPIESGWRAPLVFAPRAPAWDGSFSAMEHGAALRTRRHARCTRGSLGRQRPPRSVTPPPAHPAAYIWPAPVHSPPQRTGEHMHRGECPSSHALPALVPV